MKDPNTLGVALTKCYFCHENDAIIMNTRLTPALAKSVESMNGMVINMEPCQKCQDAMKKGVLLITIDDDKSGPGWNKEKMPNPYRTGGWFVVSDDFVKRTFDVHNADYAIKHRWMFIEDAAARMLGLFDAEPLERR